MQDKRLKHLGIVGFISKQAGTWVGTTAAFGKKGAGFGTRGVGAVADLFRRPVKDHAAIAEEESEITSEAAAFEQSVEYATIQKNSPGVPVATLEPDFVAVRYNLMEAGSEMEKRQSQLESQFEDIRAKKESLVSNLKKTSNETDEIKTRKKTFQAQMAALESDLTATRRELEKLRSKEKDNNSRMSDVSSVKTQAETVLPVQNKHKVTVVPINKNVTSSMKVHVARPDKNTNVKIADQKPRSLTAEDKLSSPPHVLLEQVRAAFFSNTTEKIIFTRAFSDIASQDAAARTDAARVLAGIRHELSIRILVAQMACEPSPQVRQECIKALTTLKMKEGLPAVERALTDQNASVRLAAVWGLYHLAGIESAPMLIRMFSDDDEDVRRRAATCIGWLGQKKLAIEMPLLLADDRVSVRRAAVEAMGNLRSRQVVPFLIECLNDPDESIRKAVLIAIETITGKKLDEPFPENETSFKCLIARWREWWRDEQPK